MKKSKLYMLMLIVVLAMAVTMAATAASPLTQYGWNDNCWNYGTCYITPTNCTDPYYCGSGYGYGFGTYCQRQYSKAYQAEFITDITYPDGTYVAPGSGFMKVWRVRNVGNCTWGYDVRLVFTNGDSMGGPQYVNLPHPVAPGESVDISVFLRGPAGGFGRSEWMLQTSTGEIFGVGCNGTTPLWVSVSSWSNGGSSCYCYGEVNCPCSPCYRSNCGPTNLRYGKNPSCNNKARNVVDITIPDGTIMRPGTIFRKTWRIKNGATCVWNENYSLIFNGGDDMGGVSYSHLDLNRIIYGSESTGQHSQRGVYQGDYIEVSIDLKAPTTPGHYRAYYKLRDNLGYEFGYGSYANTAFWVDIEVAGEPVGVTTTTSVSTTAQTSVETTNSAAVVASVPAVTASTVATQGTAAASTNQPVQVAAAETTVKNNVCGAQRIEMSQVTDNSYNVNWFATNEGTSSWTADTYRLVNTGMNARLSLAEKEFVLPDTAPNSEASVTFPVQLSTETISNEDPLWMEFHLTDGTEQFCEFYFEIPR